MPSHGTGKCEAARAPGARRNLLAVVFLEGMSVPAALVLLASVLDQPVVDLARKFGTGIERSRYLYVAPEGCFAGGATR